MKISNWELQVLHLLSFPLSIPQPEVYRIRRATAEVAEQRTSTMTWKIIAAMASASKKGGEILKVL
jgi:hypothetical protein